MTARNNFNYVHPSARDNWRALVANFTLYSSANTDVDFGGLLNELFNPVTHVVGIIHLFGKIHISGGGGGGQEDADDDDDDDDD